MSDISKTTSSLLKLVIAIAIAVLTGILAQVVIYIGPVPYTMQNTAIVLSGLILPPVYASLSQLMYLVMIAIGLPMASGFRGGMGILLGYTGGYLIAFPIASMLMSILSRLYLRKRKMFLDKINKKDFVLLLCLSALSTLPIYILGFVVFTYHALGNERLIRWTLSIAQIVGVSSSNILTMIFIASVAIFIPQDLFIDHVIAISVAKTLAYLLRSKGIGVE